MIGLYHFFLLRPPALLFRLSIHPFRKCHKSTFENNYPRRRRHRPDREREKRESRCCCRGRKPQVVLGEKITRTDLSVRSQQQNQLLTGRRRPDIQKQGVQYSCQGLLSITLSSWDMPANMHFPPGLSQQIIV